MWIRQDKRGVVITGVVVDDFAITGSSDHAVDSFVHELMQAWDCTFLGDLEWCLNLRVRRNRQSGTMFVDQTSYIQDIAERFGMQDVAPISTPADPSVKLSKSMGPANETERIKMKQVPYKSAVGAVLYTRLTRADCITSIVEVARFMEDPDIKH